MSRLSGDRGVTLVELSVTIFMVVSLGVMAVAWLGAGMRAESASDARDTALSEVRLVRQEMVREIRFAREVTSGSATSVTLWLDHDADGVVDAGETVTWAFVSNGTLTRRVDSGAPVTRASSLVPNESSFTFDPAPPPNATSIQIDLTLDGADLGGVGGLDTSTSVSLRNG